MDALDDLYDAVVADSLEDVFQALDALKAQKGNNYFISDYYLRTAVRNQNAEILAALLTAKKLQAAQAPPDQGYDSDEDPLYCAVMEEQDLKLTKMLIAGGYPPFRPGEPTILHFAAKSGNTALLEYAWGLAVSKGININVPDDDGCTPLHAAASYCQHVSVQFLLQRGANPNDVDHEGHTVFYDMVSGDDAKEPENAEDVDNITKLLINAGFNLERATSFYLGGEATPLMQASHYGVAAAVKALLAAGANIAALNPIDQTALHLASRGGGFECVRLLLASGADVKARDVDGNTPLHDACNLDDYARERSRIVRELLNHGADVNAKNNAGETPLHVACKNICVEGVGAVDVLLDSGADVGILAAGKESCLHFVVKRLCEHCSWALLWDAYSMREAKQLAACALGFIQRLLKAGAKADLLNLEGFTPLEIIKERLGAAILNQHKDIFAPIIVALIKGGDFYSFGSVPEGCPGLGTALKAVWKERSEMLSQLFVKMVPGEQERVRMTLRCLQRYLPNEEVRMEIISKACSNV